MQDKQQGILQRIFPHWRHVDNYMHAQLGRIWILYNDNVRLQIHCCSSQAMHFHIFLESIGIYFSSLFCMLQIMPLREEDYGLN